MGSAECKKYLSFSDSNLQAQALKDLSTKSEEKEAEKERLQKELEKRKSENPITRSRYVNKRVGTKTIEQKNIAFKLAIRLLEDIVKVKSGTKEYQITVDILNYFKKIHHIL